MNLTRTKTYILKKIISVLLITAILFSVIPQSVIQGSAAGEAYNDISEYEVYNMLLGEGTKDSPFEIRAPYDVFLINYVEYWHTVDDAPVY